jgi:O-antigen ligase
MIQQTGKRFSNLENLQTFIVFYAMTHLALGRTLGLVLISNPVATFILIISIIMMYFLYSKVVKHNLSLSFESRLLMIWFIWSYVITIFFSKYGNYESILPPNFRVILISLLLFIFFRENKSIKSEEVLLRGLKIGGIILIFLSLLFGQGLFSGKDISLGGNITDNRNDFGYLLLFGFIGNFYYYLKTRSNRKRILYLVIIFMLAFLIISTTSRKMFIGLVVFLVIAFWYNYSKSLFRKASVIFYLALVIMVLALSIQFVLFQTRVGERLTDTYYNDTEKGIAFENRFANRGVFYVEGLEIATNNPIIGIGLDNFRFYSSTSMPSHSDYMEILSGTGLVGFILYFLVYFIAIRKILKKMKFDRNSADRIKASVLYAALISILVVALGKWNYNHPLTYIFVASLLNFSTLTKKRKLL